MGTSHQHEGDVIRDAVEWFRAHVELRESTSAEALYERMESQAAWGLPVIYLPFDGGNRGHFRDRAQIIDYAVVCGPGRVLDFGPGDGWPSLPMAPMVEEVIGVDGSPRRVEVCAANAKRMGLGNAQFVHVPPGEPLPFEDESFDGVAAASSVEQTPDVRATLAEMFRVLKPGGRLRMHYESLSYYAGGRERQLDVGVVGDTGDLMIHDRHLEEEYVDHYVLTFDLSEDEVVAIFARHDQDPPNATVAVLADLKPHIAGAATWRGQHPSCRSWMRLLREAGFSAAVPTYDGGWFAKRLFDRLPEAERPRDLAAADEVLRPLVEVVAGMEAPPTAPPREWEPCITATK